jgi:hypothetical protein
LNQNNLLVNEEVFSDIACLDGRMFGVTTHCDSCELELNNCLRSHIFNNLITAQQVTEDRLGYNLTPRYHTYEFEVRALDKHEKIRLLLDHPGVAKMNVKQEISTILSNVAVSPYLMTGVAAIDDGLGYCKVVLPTSVVDNPTNVLLRDSSTQPIPTAEMGGYPKRVGANWEVAIGSAPCAVGTYSVQHCKLVYVDIPTATSCLNCLGVANPAAEILPVYRGTTEFIPLAKPIETVGANKRYWFYAWSLADKAFRNESINLAKAEFWKLYPSIDFVCVQEVTAGPDVVCPKKCNCGYDRVIADPCALPPIVSDITTEILDAHDGLVELCPTKTLCSCKLEGGENIRVKLYYKTDPSVMGLDRELPNISRAVAFFAAANLPNSFCGCSIKVGFIFESQQTTADAKINPFTGETVFIIEFGNTYGHYMYANLLAKAPKFTKLKRI